MTPEFIGLTGCFSPQRPYIPYISACAEMVRETGAAQGAPVLLIAENTLQKTKELLCELSNRAVLYRGKFETANLPDAAYLARILKRGFDTDGV